MLSKTKKEKKYKGMHSCSFIILSIEIKVSKKILAYAHILQFRSRHIFNQAKAYVHCSIRIWTLAFLISNFMQKNGLRALLFRILSGSKSR